MAVGEYEIILVEDGSNDLSAHKLKAQCKLPNLTYIHTGNHSVGSAKARNLGIKQAKGEICVFLDCDMLVERDFLEQHCRFHQAMPSGKQAVQFGLRKMLKQNSTITYASALNHLRIDQDFELEARHFVFQLYSENLGNYQSAWYYCFSCNLSIPRCLLEEHGGFDEHFVGWGLEDNELGYRMYLNGATPMLNPAIEAYHQYHGPEVSQAKVEGIMPNLNYINSKYDDVPTTLLRALCLHQQKFAGELNGIEKSLFIARTQQFYRSFEESLRLYAEPTKAFTERICLKNPTALELDTLLQTRPNLQLTIICQRQLVDTLIACQLHPLQDQIQLYCV